MDRSTASAETKGYLSKVSLLKALMLLVIAAAEPTAKRPSSQLSNQPSMALLLYLDEFPDQNDDMVDIALICTNEPPPKNDQAAGLRALVQCETLPSTIQSTPALKTTSGEITPDE